MPDPDFARIIQKLAIGTAQFGLPYGISNRSGQCNFEEVCRILKTAALLGIDTIDTAAAYGNSEEVLGKALAASGTSFRLVTKLSGNEGPVNETLGNSLQKLRTEQVYGCLLHDFSVYQQQPQLFSHLQALKQEGKISQIGFSLYYPHQAQELLDKNESFDLVQVPYNLFDRRFETVFKDLKKLGVEIHTRSVFLQGLFFMETQKISPYFAEVLPQLQAVQAFSKQHQIPLNLLLLGFAALNPEIDKIVIGVENVAQLQHNAAFNDYLPQVEKLYPQLQQFAQDNEEILLPFYWKI